MQERHQHLHRKSRIKVWIKESRSLSLVKRLPSTMTCPQNHVVVSTYQYNSANEWIVVIRVQVKPIISAPLKWELSIRCLLILIPIRQFLQVWKKPHKKVPISSTHALCKNKNYSSKYTLKLAKVVYVHKVRPKRRNSRDIPLNCKLVEAVVRAVAIMKKQWRNMKCFVYLQNRLYFSNPRIRENKQNPPIIVRIVHLHEDHRQFKAMGHQIVTEDLLSEPLKFTQRTNLCDLICKNASTWHQVISKGVIVQLVKKE